MFSKRLCAYGLALLLVLSFALFSGCARGDQEGALPPTDTSSPATATRVLSVATATSTPTTPPDTLTPALIDEAPDPSVTPEPAPTPTPHLYVVQTDDTLVSIAIDFGVDLDALMEANDLSEDSLFYPGQELVIPSALSGEASNTVSYRIEAGDTFASIAAKFGVSPESLQRANPDVDPTALQVGQELDVPWDGVHIVGPGDTLATIAEKYQVNYDDLIEANKDVLDATNLDLVYPGMALVIPREGGETVDCSPQPSRTAVIEYVVRRGERLFCLARKFSVSETTLLYANPHLIDPGGLTEGVTIHVPPDDGALYTVTATDVENDVTLADIALWYNAQEGLNQIVDWEGNAVSLPLSAGQQLFIPGADLLAGSFNSADMIEAYPGP